MPIPVPEYVSTWGLLPLSQGIIAGVTSKLLTMVGVAPAFVGVFRFGAFSSYPALAVGILNVVGYYVAGIIAWSIKMFDDDTGKMWSTRYAYDVAIGVIIVAIGIGAFTSAGYSGFSVLNVGIATLTAVWARELLHDLVFRTEEEELIKEVERGGRRRRRDGRSSLFVEGL
jgi:hypothetical protein